jgi:hypothetical protein
MDEAWQVLHHLGAIDNPPAIRSGALSYLVSSLQSQISPIQIVFTSAQVKETPINYSNSELPMRFLPIVGSVRFAAMMVVRLGFRRQVHPISPVKHSLL